MKAQAKDKLIVALDVPSSNLGRELFDELNDLVGMFKIGSQLFTAAGPEIVRQIVTSGGSVFLDLKFHDIPNTVAAAAVAATRLGVSILNVHAAGGAEMLRRTVAAVTEVASKESLSKPKIIAVTVLTSLDRADLVRLGLGEEPQQMVKRLARLASDCGLDGVVASPREIGAIRETTNNEFIIVTPGIRSANTEADDQQRTLSAAEAIGAGADYLVVGRPILKASDRRKAAEVLIKEIEGALQSP